MGRQEEKVFSHDNMFSYNRAQKQAFAGIALAAGIILVFLIAYYFLFLRESENPIIVLINLVLANISGNIYGTTMLGLFYTALFGGLFVVPLPMELIFMSFVRAGINPLLLVLIFVGGLFISYNVNYFIGKKLSNISRKLITPKKFYRIKGTINRYGALAVFAFNVLPLPSQPLSTILGVFNYNRTRFYVLFVSGQLLKYTAIALGYRFFAG